MAKDNISFGIRGNTDQLPSDLTAAEQLFDRWTQGIQTKLESVAASFEALASEGEINVKFNDAEIQSAYDAVQDVVGRFEAAGEAASHVDGKLGEWGSKLEGVSGKVGETVGVLGAMANIAEIIVSTTLGWIKNATGYTAELEKSLRLTKQIADVQANTRQRQFNNALEIEAPEDRDAEIARLGRDARNRQRNARRELEEAEAKLPSSFLTKTIDDDALNAAVENAKAQLESANKEVEQYHVATRRSIQLEKRKTEELDRQRDLIKKQIALKEAEERGGKLERKITSLEQQGFSREEATQQAERFLGPDLRKEAAAAEAKARREAERAEQQAARDAARQQEREQREQQRLAERDLSTAERNVARARRTQSSNQSDLERFAQRRRDLIRERDTPLGGFDRSAFEMANRIATAAATPSRDIESEILAVDKEIADTEKKILQANESVAAGLQEVKAAIEQINTGMR